MRRCLLPKQQNHFPLIFFTKSWQLFIVCMQLENGWHRYGNGVCHTCSRFLTSITIATYFFLRNGGFACVKECTYKICTNCFVVIFLGFFCLSAQNEAHLLFWRNMVNQYEHQWNKNELILFGGVRCVYAKKIIHTEYKFYWKYAYILYSKLFNARYRQPMHIDTRIHCDSNAFCQAFILAFFK